MEINRCALGVSEIGNPTQSHTQVTMCVTDLVFKVFGIEWVYMPSGFTSLSFEFQSSKHGTIQLSPPQLAWLEKLNKRKRKRKSEYSAFVALFCFSSRSLAGNIEERGTLSFC